MMKKYALLITSLIFLTLPLVTQAQSAAGLPSPCQSEWPKVYLVVDNTRRHIVNWDTFLNLGYRTPDIVPCGDAADDPEGQPVTNLFKGSGVEVYLVQDGVRRHIPDMDTFNAFGFRTADISVLPDDFIAKWPLGEPIESVGATAVSGDQAYREFTLNNYTVRLWHPGQGTSDFATISRAGQADVRVEYIRSVGELPVTDVNGDGDPDLLFIIDLNGSAHCCDGTAVYSLGTEPRLILSLAAPAYQLPNTGLGEFQDIDGDGRYEFVTHDPLQNIPCTQPGVYTILQYDAAQGKYVGATPHFAAYRADMLAGYLNLPTTSDPCTIYGMVTTLSYFGKTEEARAAYDRLYKGENAADYWDTLQNSVRQGRFYTAVD